MLNIVNITLDSCATSLKSIQETVLLFNHYYFRKAWILLFMKKIMLDIFLSWRIGAQKQLK